MEKLLAMHAAALLTQAVLQNRPDTLPQDIDLKDASVRAENLMAWEVFRVFYAGICKALEDNVAWPPPKMQPLTAALGSLGALAPLLQAGPLAELLKKAAEAIPAAKQPAPLPMPGQPIS